MHMGGINNYVWLCRHCVKEPHEPCDCKLWQRWTELISTNGDGRSTDSVFTVEPC